MTIFDTLRYPISDHPTITELEAIPEDIFKQWRLEANFTDVSKRPYEIHRAMQSRLGKTHSNIIMKFEFDTYYGITNLRKLIAEYDNI